MELRVAADQDVGEANVGDGRDADVATSGPKGDRQLWACSTQAGAITQNPIGIGSCVVESAVKALKGEKLPKTVDTGFYWYDKSNVGDPKVAAVLYN